MDSYFGVKWNAPGLDDAVPVETPVGRLCFQCKEPVVAGESGVFQAVLLSLDRPATREPAHIECFLRSILGCVQHLEHTCTCFGGDMDERQVTRPYREQARETMEWLVLHSS